PMPRRTLTVLALFTAVAALVAGCTTPTRGSWSPMPVTSQPGATPTPGPAPAPAPDLPGGSSPVADPVYPDYGNPTLDVLHYDLQLRWSPTKKELTGTASLMVRATAPLTEIGLDFSSALKVDS